MPKIRNEVANEVRAAFRAAEQAAEDSAAAISRCIAVVVDARRRAKLPPIAGAEAISLIAKSSQFALGARQHMLEAHPLLTQMGKDLSVISFGPDGGCVPNEPFTTGATPLRVVAGGN